MLQGWPPCLLRALLKALRVVQGEASLPEVGPQPLVGCEGRVKVSDRALVEAVMHGIDSVLVLSRCVCQDMCV